MLTFIISFLLLCRLGLSKPIRYVLVVLIIGLIVVAITYAMDLFLTLEERTSPYHVYAQSLR
jgi:hypothetical protein